ncbi:neuroligin-1-like [Tropilaelaps mercedesae]|uniref:Neuroligin-1-like n=1 Tax=Tropilaelaps mercedesae TaxID=418985 RepID=A0A1V9Y1H3_9ACAR|nr:neuroligin-1-like [Tropilaelaps mercedesae]
MARRRRLPLWGVVNGALCCLVLANVIAVSRPLLERDFADWKQSERVVRTLFGKIRGRVVLPQGRFHDIALQPVEVFLGVPYASPPVGSLRFLPPMTPAHWDGVREADHWGPNCPQPPPETPPHWSRQRPYFSKDEDRERTPANRSWTPWPQMADFLQDNQSEDCLYLNIFAPASVGRTEHGKLPVLALAAGASLEWGGAALLDATALAAAAHALIVTFNFRLGVLGFFPAMDEASRANNALLDQDSSKVMAIQVHLLRKSCLFLNPFECGLNSGQKQKRKRRKNAPFVEVDRPLSLLRTVLPIVETQPDIVGIQQNPAEEQVSSIPWISLTGRTPSQAQIRRIVSSDFYQRIEWGGRDARLATVSSDRRPARPPGYSNAGYWFPVAALHWVQRNIDSFGGDHTRTTLLGHGRAGSLAHFLAMYPLAKDLFRSVALMSGSALSPWSLCQPVNAQRFATQLAQSLSCPTRPAAMVECLRHKTADELVEMSRFPDEVPDHLCGPFGPVVDNSVISAGGVRAAMTQSPFLDHDLLLGVTTRGALSLFSAEERRDGIEAALKERLIRTLVRNTYDYHQQEIFLTIANEYTDWSRSTPTRHDILAEAAAALADGTVVAPLVETGVLHAQAVQIARSRASTHLLVFGAPGESSCTPRMSSSVRASCGPATSDALPRDLLYLLGLPLRAAQRYSHIAKRLASK